MGRAVDDVADERLALARRQRGDVADDEAQPFASLCDRGGVVGRQPRLR